MMISASAPPPMTMPDLLSRRRLPADALATRWTEPGSGHSTTRSQAILSDPSHGPSHSILREPDRFAQIHRRMRRPPYD